MALPEVPFWRPSRDRRPDPPTDKRKIRRDISDVFCTKAEGFRARDAKKYNIVDGSFPRSKWADGIAARASEIVSEQDAKFPNRKGAGVALPALSRTDTDDGWSYTAVDVTLDGRVANIMLKGPEAAPERSAETWSLRAFRELEDALLRLRVNHLEIGLINLRTQGDAAQVLAHEEFILSGAADDWFLAEIKHFQHQCLRRLDNMAKSTFALIETGHCFVGTLFEMALSADRIYMFMDDDGENTIQLSRANNGVFPMANGMTRLQARFPGEPDAVAAAESTHEPIDAEEADDMGLVTASLDDIDWDDEVRIAIEERVSMSPDALIRNRTFASVVRDCRDQDLRAALRLANWIFQRPNAVGDRGALTLYGHPERPVFDYRRT